MKIRSIVTASFSVLTALLLLFVAGQFLRTTAKVNPKLDPDALSIIQSSVGNWQIDTVESGVSIGKNTSLALDKSGLPHISYGDFKTLKYAWYDGTNWHIETVASFEYVGVESSLGLDESDHPHIGYYDADTGYLMYAWREGTSWRTEIVDDRAAGGMYITMKANQGLYDASHISLAVDGMGRPHISYRGYQTEWAHGLNYAWRNGTTWYIEAVDGWHSGYYSSLALDESDNPHISYYHSISEFDDLMYARRDGTTWHIETVDSEGDVGKSTSLALDGEDRPRISYYDDTNDSLKHAWYDGLSWHAEMVDVDEYGAKYNALAVDREGHSRIVYGSKYAWHDGVNWHIETICDSSGVAFISLALDKLDWPHIAYFDHPDALGYAYLTPLPTLSLNKQATPGSGLRNNDILTYTLILSGSGLSVQLWDPLPANVHYIAGSVTPPATYSSTIRTIVWQGILATDTAQLIQFRVTPGITGTGSLSLSLPFINTAWLTDTENSRSVSATVIVNGRRIYLPLVVRNR